MIQKQERDQLFKKKQICAICKKQITDAQYARHPLMTIEHFFHVECVASTHDSFGKDCPFEGSTQKIIEATIQVLNIDQSSFKEDHKSRSILDCVCIIV